MTGLLAALLAGVVLYCLARSVLPRLQGPDHARDLDAWHVLMAGAMVAMLLVASPRLLSVVGLAAFAAGLVWAVARLARGAGRAAYAGLGVGCAAMAVMLLQPATASAARSASSAGAVQHAAHHTGHTGPAAASGGSPGLVPPTLLLLGVLGALAVLLVVRLLGSVRRVRPLPARLDACCDVAMAGAMGYMLVLML